MPEPDLGVQLGPLRLRNPVMTASGTSGFGREIEPFLPLSCLGALVTKGLTLEKLIFDVLKCDPVTAHVRDLVELQPDEPDTATPATRSLKEIAAEALRPETTAARIRELYGEIGPMKAAMVPGENGAEVPIAELLIRLGRARAAGEPADQQAHRRMHALWGKAGITDRAERLAFTSEILGRDIASSTELTAADAVQVIDRLGAYIQQQTPPAPAEAAAA